jgi:glycogen(starch) synthase
MRIVLPTEVFPPKAGGAGWSARALALGLKKAGHDVWVITTAAGPKQEGDVPVIRLEDPGGRFRRGRVAEMFRQALSETSGPADIIHAQHALSALGALQLSPKPKVVVTVRDHWPVCFWSTRISQGALCPQCSTLNMWRCIDGRLPWASAPVAIPYMKWDLADKRRALGQADAVIAVSESIAVELRAARIPSVQVLPNIVDAQEVTAIAAEPPKVSLPDRFLLFVGKLEANKGAEHLIHAVSRSRASLPLVILGTGSKDSQIRAEAASLGIEVVAPGWAERNDVLRAMKRTVALVFPSTWPEPFSRVLLEALALGTPIAAMDTGGTSELVVDDVSGLLARDRDDLGDALGRIVHDGNVRSRLTEGARLRARDFSPERLIPRYESLYRGLL